MHIFRITFWQNHPQSSPLRFVKAKIFRLWVKYSIKLNRPQITPLELDLKTCLSFWQMATETNQWPEKPPTKSNGSTWFETIVRDTPISNTTKLAREPVKQPILLTLQHRLLRSRTFNFIHFYSSMAAFFQSTLLRCHVMGIYDRMQRCFEVSVGVLVVQSLHFNDVVTMFWLSRHFYVLTKMKKNLLLRPKHPLNNMRIR